MRRGETMRFIVKGALVGIMLAGCRDVVEPGDDLDPGSTPFEYSAQAAVAHFGRYRIDPPGIPPVAAPTTTPDGEFVTSATSPSGHRVGRVNGRLAIWPLDAASPTYMFPADTNEAPLSARAISDRSEVLLISGTAFSHRVYAWKDGQMATVAGPDCLEPVGLNMRGLIAMNTCGYLYNSGRTVLSPFSPDPIKTDHFAGEVCDVGGRYSRVIAIDDDNDILWGIERRPGAGEALVVKAAGCLDLTDKFQGVTASWKTLRLGMVGGSRVSAGSTAGVIADGVYLADLNDLLDAATLANWRVESVVRINAGGAIDVRAISTADGHTETIRLVRAN